jgi:hypothetical protein
MKHPTFIVPKTLFIVKRRYGYENCVPGYSKESSSGLFNSANFVSNMLIRSGIESSVVDVVDNNDIEREVFNFRPTHVFIEALWVTPDKLKLLAKKYPSIQWVIRIHSNTPFLANEGIAIEWLKGYLTAESRNVQIAPNSKLLLRDLYALSTDVGWFVYLPNYYEFSPANPCALKNPTEIHVGCFGAIRPLKNQLIQAIAAIKFANSLSRTLVFHINSARVEQRGNPVLKNIQALFSGGSHRLVEHQWLDRKQFLAVIGSMDINLQVSLTETFNITAADSVNEFVPVVVGKDIDWVDKDRHADTSSSEAIVIKMKELWEGNMLKSTKKNWLDLHLHNAKAKGTWLRFLIEK